MKQPIGRRPLIDRTDSFSLVAVWEIRDRQWQLLCLDRLARAIALYQQLPSKRLIFPTDINLDRTASEEEPLYLARKVLPPAQVKEQLSQLIAKFPGITTKTVATRLNFSCITARKYLRLLESEQKICCQLSAWDGKSHTYYPAKVSISQS